MFKDDQLQGHSGHGQAKSHTTQTTNGQKAASATAEVKVPRPSGYFALNIPIHIFLGVSILLNAI